ncbi:MAG TPA: helix-turn-helix transcriptional regulator [Ktedonobacteraceae bacterium]
MTPNRRLKQARELRGWSQAKVAEQIGTDATTVSRWERGLFSPTPYFRERLCTLFSQNAEELGLLESEQSRTEELQRSLSPRSPAPLAFQQDTPKGGSSTSTIAPPDAPSWPRRGDTFGYILDSAAHDQQAHTLWEDAYVRAMRGQRAEAQQLGEASLNAFEHVGHPNAEAIREWLKKNELLSPPPPSTTVPPAPLPLLPKPSKRNLKSILRPRNVGLAFVLLAIGALSLVSFALNHSPAPSVQAGTKPGFLAKSTQVAPQNTAQGAGSVFVTPTSAAATPTQPAATQPTKPTAASNANPLNLMITVSPTSLKPASCHVDSGYRCELWITLYSNGQASLNWQASSPDLMVKWNQSSGIGKPGTPFEVIVYIQSAPGQSGQLIFTVTSSSYTKQATVSWQG